MWLRYECLSCLYILVKFIANLYVVCRQLTETLCCDTQVWPWHTAVSRCLQSCIPSGVAYTAPLEPLLYNLQFYTFHCPFCCLVSSITLCTYGVSSSPGNLLSMPFVPVGFGNECGNFSQLKWSISPWGRFKF